ncbi:hypothetical protein [Roseateles saccharophilus]|uniref:Uncharacterized protein n=1 Tax=Roseateles saccharophilus TaxID=304 RepID=A0A4R3UIF4_ROSSA|nr:hypothetical protein [Roseateles saccharophilus]MDG0834173.1 hypothetical protein [Roseateles saccharophilus]TCU91305.1 hypothetical protein EV671_102620 [Roseateles saccharophilus]
MAEITADRSEIEQLPLGPGARQLGADAVAEQRELLSLLLDESNQFSGFAKRGMLMRILDLSDLAAELFEGVSGDEPYILAGRLHGLGNKACSEAAAAIQAERGTLGGSS